MIAVDTSSFRRYLAGESGETIERRLLLCPQPFAQRSSASHPRRLLATRLLSAELIGAGLKAKSPTHSSRLVLA